MRHKTFFLVARQDLASPSEWLPAARSQSIVATRRSANGQGIERREIYTSLQVQSWLDGDSLRLARLFSSRRD